MAPLIKYIIKRIFLLFIVISIVITVTFILSHIVPGDPARLYAGPHATAKQIEMAREELGLDKPPLEQYIIYWIKLFKGDLGISIHTRRPVIEDLIDYFPATIELTLFSMIITIIFGIILGILSAIHKDKTIDHVCRLQSLMGVAMPLFWLGILFQLLFSHSLAILPTSGRVDSMIEILYPQKRITGLYLIDSLITGNIPFFINALHHIILPSITLSFATLAVVSRMMRASLIEVLNQEYITTSKSLGLPERIVIYKYALKNALIPVVTIIGLSFGYSLGGVFLIEVIFDWPGLGRYTTDAILTLDYPAILGTTLLATIVYVIINLIVDIIYAYINPKIKY